MPEHECSPAAVVARFIDCINRGDADGLGRLMTENHELRVFDEPPLQGRAANIEAWRGYASNWPAYTIYPQQVVESAAMVAVVGHTTGSHLELPDEEESRLTLIWVAEVGGGLLRYWQLIPDDAGNRARFGLRAAG